jgi:molybdate transport system substrate-binding protein
MSNLNILSGGAAQGFVASLGSEFKAATGLDITGEFGAVGVMADKLRGGAAADIVILTSALLAKLAAEKLVVPSSITDVGLVETALAVRASDPKVTANDQASLRAAFLAADEIFVPDTMASTAGIHVAKVLSQLGIADEVATRLRIHPNGATAMRHLASSAAKRPLGCTQATEIVSTKGIVLSGSLPDGCDLATMYTAGITAKAADAKAAQTLIDLLTSTDHSQLRAQAGFISKPN